jgi:hypothetical protein
MNLQKNQINRGIFFSGLIALLFTHLFSLTHVAGWHLDEAWAGNFAHRIAFENGFWPFQAMSPYTAAWSHYIAAAAFRIFGTNVFVYRAAGIFEVILGTVLISLALAKRGEVKAAALLPGVIALFPALVMNQRWVIEMNTFFVLCAGVVVYGIATKRIFLSFIGFFLGITSHVLFLAPSLALLYWCWVEEKLSSRDRKLISAFSIIIGLFFVRIYFKTESDDHTKALGLIAISVITMIGVHVPTPPKYFLTLPAILGIPLLLPFFLFSEGTWVALFSSGELQTPFLIGTIFIPVALLIFYLKPRYQSEILWLPLCLILTLLMVVKPGPRYYEIPFLFCAVLFTIGVSRITPNQAKQVLALWFTLGALQLSLNYFQPAIAETQIDRTFHLWRFRDSSSDMLPSQKIARRLSREGCDYSDLKLSDDRMEQCLKFLSYGDWPVPNPHHCRFGTQVDVLKISGNEGQFTIKPPSAHE